MVQVEFVDEPDWFDSDVRLPGNQFVAANPEVDPDKLPTYWRKSIDYARTSYDETCCYLACWIPPGTGSESIDHFRPKSKHYEYVYEWSNYRYSALLPNSLKREHEDVADPFLIPQDFLQMDVPSLMVLPDPSLSEMDLGLARSTIRRLKLNDHSKCIESRQCWVDGFARGKFPFDFLQEVAPFVARQLVRLGLNSSERLREKYLIA